MNPEIKFGTDGWRGIMGEDFTPENVARVIQAFCDRLKKVTTDRLILLGYDRRANSDQFAKTVASVLTGNGFSVLQSSQFCPTPCLAWNTKDQKAAAGVMVTASHNPAIWNGIKFKESYGGAASPEYTTEVEKIIVENEKTGKKPQSLEPRDAQKKGLLKEFDPKKDYLKSLQQFVDLKKIQAAHWKIGFDPLYGAGSGFLSPILEQDIFEIHAEAKPDFGGLNPEPIQKNLGGLIQMVREKKLDVGLATDGDADRIGAVDEEGNFVDSHHIFALILKHLVEVRKGHGEIIKTVSTTGMIDRLSKKYGLRLHELPIGFKHICKKLGEISPLVAGEESGGIAIAQHLYERDGLLSGLMLLEIMSHNKKKLGELVRELHQELGPHFFEREDLHLSPAEIQKVRERLPSLKIESLAGQRVVGKVIIDGFKYQLADGSWLLVRPSGTEPLLRLYAEADDPAKVKKLMTAAREIITV
ncbi:MAG: phosphoglucomutase/phosphomannomutase family protein [Deltaproteobacteria bacterium]|nr:phosphoglucomutase/phosphomannomutase family protein [Deltaproteobacteria bacterium]